MPGLRVAKADEKDFNTTRSFLQACEMFWDTRMFGGIEWEYLDDDDPDKKILLAIRKSLAEEDRVSERSVDDRLVVYEFLRRKYRACDCNWNRVVMAGDVLIDNVCDPTEDHLAFYPGIELYHVAPEQ